MKNGIIFLIVAALVAIVLFFTYKIVKTIRAQKIIDELYAAPNRGKGFVARVLVTAFGHGRVINGAVIPVKRKGGTTPPATADALLVTRAGIIVVTIMPYAGKLDNPQNEPWRILTPSGQVVTVDNPFDRNAYMIEVLKHILRKDGFHNIALHSIVVVSNCRAVHPKYTYRNMFTENSMIDAIKSIMIDRQMSFTETRDVRRTVKASLAHHEAQQAAK